MENTQVFGYDKSKSMKTVWAGKMVTLADKPAFQAKPGKNDNAIANLSYINSQAYADKFAGRYENKAVEDAVVKACRQLIKSKRYIF